MRYIKFGVTKGIAYHEPNELTAHGFSDSDWASCSTTRKSTEGYVFRFGGGAVSCRSRKQSIVATSSCEAEYVAAFTATKESIWMSKMIAEMVGADKPSPQAIFVIIRELYLFSRAEQIEQQKQTYWRSVSLSSHRFNQQRQYPQACPKS